MPEFIPRKHMHTIKSVNTIFFFSAFFLCIFITNLKCADETFWMGFQIENSLKQFQFPKLSWNGFFLFLIKNRLPLWCLLCLAGYFRRGNFVFWSVSVWFGLTYGFFTTTLIQQFGILSLLILGGTLLPHFPLYLWGYILLINNNIKRTAAFIPKCLLLSGLFLGGALCEYYINPWLLEKISSLINT